MDISGWQLLNPLINLNIIQRKSDKKLCGPDVMQ